MLANVNQKTSTLFSIWVDDVSTAYDKMLQDLNGKIETQRTLGLTPEEIYNRLSVDLDNNADLFSTFKGSIGRSNDSLVNTVSQVESNESIEEVSELWMWELDPTVEKHCETCLSNSEEKAMSFGEWRDVGLPGYGNTECGKYCRCTLTPIE